MLEAHLNATASGIILFTEGAAPELHFPRMMGWSVVLKAPDVYVVEAHQPGSKQSSWLYART